MDYYRGKQIDLCIQNGLENEQCNAMQCFHSRWSKNAHNRKLERHIHTWLEVLLLAHVGDCAPRVRISI